MKNKFYIEFMILTGFISSNNAKGGCPNVVTNRIFQFFFHFLGLRIILYLL